MTDTGRIPDEGQPENAGAQSGGEPVDPDTSGTYTFAGPDDSVSDASAEDEELLMPSSQGAWGDAPATTVPSGTQPRQQPATSPPSENGSTAHMPLPNSTPPHGTGVNQDPATPPRRPLHLGPPVPEQSGAVRTLSDRGQNPPAAGPATGQVPAPATASPVAADAPDAPVQDGPSGEQPAPGVPAQEAMPQQTGGIPQYTPPTDAPEYLDTRAQNSGSLPGPQLGELPPESGEWAQQNGEPEAARAEETVTHAEALPAEDATAAPGAETSVTEEPDDSATVPDAPAGTEQPAAGGSWTGQPGNGEPVAAEPDVPQDTGPETGAAADAVGADGAADGTPAGMPDTAPATSAVAGTASGATGQESAPEGGTADGSGQAPEGDAETPAELPPESAEETPASAENGATGEESGSLISEDGPAADAAPSTAGEPADGAPVQAQSPAGDAEEAEGLVTDAEAPEPGAAASPETQPPGDAAQEAQETQEAADVPAPEAPDAPETSGVPASESGPARETAQEEGADTTATQEPAAAQDELQGQEREEPQDRTAADAADGSADQEQQPEAEQPQPGALPAAAEQVTAGSTDEAALQEQDAAGEPVPERDPAEGLVPVPDPEAIPQAAEPADAEEQDAPEGAAEQAGHDEGEGDTGAPAPSAGEPAPGFAEADREAVHRLMRERRDIRNGFRNDPIPDDVLLRVLEAAHTAPSVGHSQPWDFVVIRSGETRQTMHELAQRQREAYARSLPKARAKQFKELKIEAILDAPVNIVVTADPTRGGRHTLGRHTQPQMAPYSSALAVENLWLAARAEGLGVGWVSFFDEREMVRTLELPEHLDVVAYLCVGYVDEFPAEPELAQAGWSKRRPLSWVVHEESYGRRVLPGAEPHDLLSETVDAIRPLDAKALGEAWERQKRMTKPSGALGMLEIISAQLCGLSRKCPPPLPEPAAVAVFAGDHGVHAQGVTPWPQEVTGQMVANFLDGGAVCNSFANQVGAEVCIVDVGVKEELPPGPGLLPRKVRAGTADMTAGPALTREEAQRAVEVGIETARDLVTAGNKALLTGEMGIANTTASAALIAACTGSDPAEITGRGTGISDETHARKIEVVRRALELHRPDPADPLGLLAAVGGLEHAALVGLILGGASLRTPVILDGVSAGAAALVARGLAPEALAACIAGHRSAEPGHVAALNKLGLRPLVDLDLRLGEGTGALLALPMVQSAARAMHEVATFDAAGVTEKN